MPETGRTKSIARINKGLILINFMLIHLKKQ